MVGAVELAGEDRTTSCFVTSDAQLLRFDAAAVRPQGRAAGGMAGVRLAAGARASSSGRSTPARDGVVVTVSGSSAALPGTDAGSVKVDAVLRVPGQGPRDRGRALPPVPARRGRADPGVGGAGPGPRGGRDRCAVDLPDATGRRDGSGTPASQPIAAVSGPTPG